MSKQSFFRPFPIFLALVGIVFFAATASAQIRKDTVEISPYGAYVFGGTLQKGATNLFDEDVDVDDHSAWGLRIGYNVTSRFGIEASYLHEETRLVSRGGLFEPNTALVDMDVDMLEGTMLFHMGSRRFRPFFSMGFGATRLDLHDGDFSSDTRARFSLGGGFKLWFAPNAGMRMDVKRHWTAIDTDSDNCRHCDDENDVLGQTEVSAGVIFAF
jgi:hypothetical protein